MAKVRDLIQHWERLQEPVRQQVNQQTRQGAPLPDALRSGLAAQAAREIPDLRVHYNSHRPTQLQAHAYTQGNDIFLAPGQERHLPHEAWHVVQQQQGRVGASWHAQGADEARVVPQGAATTLVRGPVVGYVDSSDD